jgi:hypothetical protein
LKFNGTNQLLSYDDDDDEVNLFGR